MNDPIPLHPQIESRINEYVEHLYWTREQVIEAAVIRFCGMEGMPLEDDEVYGQLPRVQTKSGETLSGAAGAAGGHPAQGGGSGVLGV